MHAWRAHGFGPPDSLRWESTEPPVLQPGQVRIAVRASAVNYPDVLYIAGTYQVKPTPPFVPGFEVAGTVIESRDDALAVGTRVAALPDTGGGHATELVTAAHNAFAIPDAMSFDDAAAMTITYQTGWFGLHRRAGLKPGETVLVHAGAGGVGSAAIQLARAAGARVIATAGGADKTAVCLKLGADAAIDYQREDFVARVKEITAGRGADVIYDPVGGDVFDKSTKCIAFEGRIVIVGFTSGRIAEARTNHVLVKNYSVVGLHWGMYRVQDPPSILAAQRALYELYARGAIRPLISSVRSMSEAREAIAAVASRGTTGKVLLANA